MDEPRYMVFGTIVRQYMSWDLARHELSDDPGNINRGRMWVPDGEHAARLTASDAVRAAANHMTRFPESYVEVVLAED